jgi:hypothetical protein
MIDSAAPKTCQLFAMTSSRGQDWRERESFRLNTVDTSDFAALGLLADSFFLRTAYHLAPRNGCERFAPGLKSDKFFASKGEIMKLKLSMLAVLAVASIGLANASDVCIPMSGRAQLAPDPTCAIMSLDPNHPYVHGACFSVKLRSGGFVVGTGSAALTAEVIVGLDGKATITPAALNEAGVAAHTNEVGQPETRKFFTARSVLNLPGGTIYTADAGVKRPHGDIEELIVTGGTEAYAGASGGFVLSGDVLSKWANYSGKVCVPQP